MDNIAEVFELIVEADQRLSDDKLDEAISQFVHALHQCPCLHLSSTILHIIRSQVDDHVYQSIVDRLN